MEAYAPVIDHMVTYAYRSTNRSVQNESTKTLEGKSRMKERV